MDALTKLRFKLLNYMNIHSLNYKDIGEILGCSDSAIGKFLRGETKSKTLSESIVKKIPELANGLTCPHCGKLTNK